MRVIIQRCSKASVVVDDKLISAIGRGLLLLIGIEHEDNETDAQWLANKIVQLRIFSDSENKMNLNVLDIKGEILVVSQFTLHASTKKGTRPSFIQAARPEIAIPLYEKFIEILETEFKQKVGRGIFGADMKVELINDGPVTLFIDSKKRE